MTAQTDAGVTGFTHGNHLILVGQRYAWAAMVSNKEITWAGMSALKAELAALKKSLEVRKDIKGIKPTSCGVWPLPVMIQ